jgi:hypothetical protein
MERNGRIRQAAWVIVAGVALGLSNWSIAYVAHRWGVPRLLTYTVSAVFDGVAVLSADLALKAARLGDSTFAPSAALFVFGAASAYFNAWHARLAGLPVAAWVFYAFPPVAALAITELQLRHDRRGALREKGRIAAPLPAFGGTTWGLHPRLAYAAIREITAHRLGVKLAGATAPVKTARTDPPPERPARRTGPPRVDRAELVARLLADRDAGLPVTINTVADRHSVTRWTSAQAIKQLANGSAR